jgi:hypothetical protein
LNAGEKEEDFPSVVVVHGPDDFVYSRVWHILAEKYRGHTERESDDDDGGCVCACQKTSRRESLTSRVLDFHEDEQTTPRKSEIV